MSVCRRFGTRLWWGIPVKLRDDIDAHFDVKIYGVGLWMCPIIPGVLVWKRRNPASR